jgi:hypothetical protein
MRAYFSSTDYFTKVGIILSAGGRRYHCKGRLLTLSPFLMDKVKVENPGIQLQDDLTSCLNIYSMPYKETVNLWKKVSSDPVKGLEDLCDEESQLSTYAKEHLPILFENVFLKQKYNKPRVIQIVDWNDQHIQILQAFGEAIDALPPGAFDHLEDMVERTQTSIRKLSSKTLNNGEMFPDVTLFSILEDTDWKSLGTFADSIVTSNQWKSGTVLGCALKCDVLNALLAFRFTLALVQGGYALVRKLADLGPMSEKLKGLLQKRPNTAALLPRKRPAATAGYDGR